MSATTTPASTRPVQPDRDAEMLARHMAQASGVHRTIIEETIESAENGRVTEAGRTACGSVDNLRGPIARFPRAVELETCPPVAATGWWHTHPASGELQEPRHSIADWGNVAFGVTDASVVSGTRDAEVVVAADDREAMLARFQEAVGMPVESNRDIIAAYRAGELQPSAATRRVQQALAPLVWREPTGLEGLEERLDALPAGLQDRGTHQHGQARAHACFQFDALLSPDVGNLRENARMANDFFFMAGSRAISQGADEAIGVVVGTLVSRWIFGR